MAHEQIEAEEEERVREFQGLPVDGDEGAPPTPAAAAAAAAAVGGGDAGESPQRVFVDDSGAAKSPVRSPQVGDAVSAEETARQERAAYARAQAAKFSKDAREASQRGEWGADGDAFKRPKDAADRLRKAIPCVSFVRWRGRVACAWRGADPLRP